MSEAFVAESGGHDEYMGQRLAYRSDPSSSDATFGAISLRDALRAVAIWLLASLALAALVALLVALVAGASVKSLRSSVGLIVAVLVVPAFFPVRRWVSQWELTIDECGEAADGVYAQVAHALKSRQVPVAVKPVRFAAAGSRGPGNYLVISEGQYAAYVGVFAYGTGLFMSWSMWRKQRLGSVIFRYIKERLLVVVGKSTEFHFHVRADPARAMREAVHNAVREGVDLAVSGATPPSLEAVFGSAPPLIAESDFARGSVGAAAVPALPPPGAEWPQTPTPARAFPPPGAVSTAPARK